MAQPTVLNDKMSLTIKSIRRNGASTTYTVNTSDFLVSSFQAIMSWKDDLTDPVKRTAAWTIYLSYILKVLNPRPSSQGYAISIGFKDQFITPVVTNGYVNFNSTMQDPQVPVAQQNDSTMIPDPVGKNNLEVADFLSNFSSGNCELNVSQYDNPNNPNQLDVNGHDLNPVTRVMLSGSFLTMLDFHPRDSITMICGGGIVNGRLMWSGHDYFYLRCLQVRGEIEMMLPNEFSQYSSLIGVIPCKGPLSENIYYESPHVGSKLQLNNSSIDTVELQFIDKWGQPLYGISDYMIELTADFVKLGNLNQPTTMRDIKNY
jgi:hypothetical protein